MMRTITTAAFLLLSASAGWAQPSSSTLRFEIPEYDLYPESIAHDAVTGDFFLGSMSHSRILRIAPDGSYRDFLPRPPAELLSTIGLKVDAQRRRLWVCTGRFNLYADHEVAPPRTGVLLFDVDDGELLGAWLMEQASDYHICNDLTVGPDGDVFVSTTLMGSVYRVSPDSAEMSLVHQLAEGRHNNGITMEPGGRTLFLSVDRTLHRLDLDTGVLAPVSEPGEAVVGIDGLYYHRGSLIAVRPAFNGVSRLVLSGDHTEVVRVEALAYDQPDFAYPTTGVLVGDSLVFVATSYADVPRTPGAAAQHGPVRIHGMPLGS